MADALDSQPAHLFYNSFNLPKQGEVHLENAFRAIYRDFENRGSVG